MNKGCCLDSNDRTVEEINILGNEFLNNLCNKLEKNMEG